MSSATSALAGRDVVSRLGGHRVLVLGDLMLDRYLWGKAERISPEAPVPVVKVEREEIRLGGAANVALNLAALGDSPVLVGMVGDDANADLLRSEFARLDFDDDGLVTVCERPTTIKTRVVAGSQQVVRIDREDDGETDGPVAHRLFERFEALMERVDAIVISDYGKGTLSAQLVERAVHMARSRGLFVAVDPKETHFHRYRDVSILTPNHHEACFAAGRKVKDDDGIRDIGEQLRERLNADHLLITRGEHGMTLISRDRQPVHIPTVAQHVFDVTGAGDTVIATLTAAVAGGIDVADACRLANVAARRAIAEVGAYAVTRDDLRHELRVLGVD